MLTKRELAKILKCSVVTIDRWRKEGMPCIHKGSYIRFQEKEVIEWLKQTDKRKD